MEDGQNVIEESNVESIEPVEKKTRPARKATATRRRSPNKKPAAVSLSPATEASPAEPVSAEPSIQWFGAIDLNAKGVPSSDHPGYYWDKQLEELNHEISTIERGLDLDMYSGEDKMKMREELHKRKTRRDAIDEARPKLRPAEKDALSRTFSDLGKRIGESMFTYSEMQKQTANAQDEARRMVMPCIEIKSQMEADYCKQRGIKIVNGKISRNHASQMAQLFGKVLGEGQVDVERFRNQR